MKIANEIYVKIAEVKKGNGNVKLKATLGSCVGIVFFDKVKKQTALAHCLLPKGEAGDNALSARYVNVAIRSLKAMLAVDEESKKNIEVKVIGGSNMMSDVLKTQSGQIGIQNIQAAFEFLRQEGFEITFQDVGGEFARQVVVWNMSGELEVTTLNKKLLKIGKAQ